MYTYMLKKPSPELMIHQPFRTCKGRFSGTACNLLSDWPLMFTSKNCKIQWLIHDFCFNPTALIPFAIQSAHFLLPFDLWSDSPVTWSCPVAAKFHHLMENRTIPKSEIFFIPEVLSHPWQHVLLQNIWGYHQLGKWGYPQLAGWVISWKLPNLHMDDDDWGYHHLWKTPICTSSYPEFLVLWYSHGQSTVKNTVKFIAAEYRSSQSYLHFD